MRIGTLSACLCAFVLGAAGLPAIAQAAPVIQLDPSNGAAGQYVHVTGSGFAANFGFSIIFDTQGAGSGSVAADGSISAFFYVPARSTVGSHTVKVLDDFSNQATTPYVVNAPSIAILPTQGPSGQYANVTGSGFAANFGFSIIFDTQAAGSGTVAADGGISTFFYIPANSTVGSHTVKVIDDYGNAATTPFVVQAPSIAILPTQGPAGQSVNVTGSGFAPNSGFGVGFTILFDGLAAGSGSDAADGGISAFFRIPNGSTVGSHTVKVVDDYGNQATTPYVVTAASITLSPTRGEVGTTVTISGGGFLPGVGFGFYQDNTFTGVMGTTRSDGSVGPFTYVIPALSLGDHRLRVIDDYGNEGTKIFTVTDPNFIILVGNFQAGEGNSGTTPFTFAVTVNNPSQQTVDVAYETADGTAVAPADYAAVSGGALSCPPGVTQTSVTVQVVGESLYEGNETFTLKLSGGTNVNAAGTGTILNDDTPGSLSIDDVSAVEKNDGTVAFQFDVTLSAASGLPVSVSVATAAGPVLGGGTAGTATSGVDFTPAATTITFPPGTTHLPVVVQVYGDPDHEIDETFSVILSAPDNATLADDRGSGTILDDDPACTPQAGDVSTLGVSRSSGALQFNWTDVAGDVLYRLYESPIPGGPFLTEVGSAPSGVGGIAQPVPNDNRFYLLAAANTACGTGPRRTCAHDRCVIGERLDSACAVCVANICAAAPACCGTTWDAGCVARVPTLCGVSCN